MCVHGATKGEGERKRALEGGGGGGEGEGGGEEWEGVENERCLFITNYLNGSDFGGPAGRLTSKWRVRWTVTVDPADPGTARDSARDDGVDRLTTTVGPRPMTGPKIGLITTYRARFERSAR